MAVYDFTSLASHTGHKIVCVQYGAKDNKGGSVAVECEDCCEVLLSFEDEDYFSDVDKDGHEGAEHMRMRQKEK